MDDYPDGIESACGEMILKPLWIKIFNCKKIIQFKCTVQIRQNEILAGQIHIEPARRQMVYLTKSKDLDW